MENEEQGFDKGSAFQRSLRHYHAFKARLLLIFFGAILLGHIAIVLKFWISDQSFQDLGLQVQNYVLFPLFVIGAALAEGKAYRYFHRMKDQEDVKVDLRISYLVIFLEACFPTVIFAYAIPLIQSSPMFGTLTWLQSPPAFVYFIFILLSALHLNLRLSLFSGVICGVGYGVVAGYFLPEGGEQANILFFLVLIKSVVLVVMGYLAGIISVRIRRSIGSALEAKEELIERLDERVKARTQELEETNHLLEERNRTIQDSIRYARRIQEAILPPQESLESYLGEHFVFYRPQHIVSGDFYWTERFQDRKEGESVIWAACDCTGHGVPGAFMSMMASSLLDEMCVENDIRDPGCILDRVRLGIKRKVDDGEQKDGMDVALLMKGSPNAQGKITVRFSGANNPLYILRKNSHQEWPSFRAYRKGEAVEGGEERFRAFGENGEGVEVKGDRQGVSPMDGERFTSIELELEQGDMVYTFSDGLPDQFGGPKGKKFGYRRFKALLSEIHQASPDEQKKIIEERFQEWKGDEEQVDDVIVMGVRL